MRWESWSQFWDMGGYGLYVWGSMAVTALSRKRVSVPPPTSKIAAKIIKRRIMRHEFHGAGKNGLNGVAGSRGMVSGRLRPQVPRGLARRVGGAEVGSSGQGWRG